MKKYHIVYFIGLMTLSSFSAKFIGGIVSQIPAVKEYQEKKSKIKEAQWAQEEKEYTHSVKGKFAVMPYYNFNGFIRIYNRVSFPVIRANDLGKYSLTESFLVHNSKEGCEKFISYFNRDKKLSCEIIK